MLEFKFDFRKQPVWRGATFGRRSEPLLAEGLSFVDAKNKNRMLTEDMYKTMKKSPSAERETRNQISVIMSGNHLSFRHARFGARSSALLRQALLIERIRDRSGNWIETL